jgi:S-adenosylmethionine hydrolase
VQRRARVTRSLEIASSPERLSASFHGRDLFAPVAAALALGSEPLLRPIDERRCRRPDWPDDLKAIVYIDRYGNAMTGLRAAVIPEGARLVAGGATLERARTFSDRAAGEAFWYENANGLAEIAVNRGRADATLGLAVGAPVEVATP